jgi:hypothetical protein
MKDPIVHSSFVAPPLGLTDAVLVDERLDPPELDAVISSMAPPS